MSDIYRENILDHARRPRNYGVLVNATQLRHESNPSCGDVIDLYLIVNAEGRVSQVSFTGSGCVVSQASTSIVLEHVIGKHIDEVKAMGQSEVIKLLGVEPGPMRMGCALLPLRALQRAIN